MPSDVKQIVARIVAESTKERPKVKGLTVGLVTAHEVVSGGVWHAVIRALRFFEKIYGIGWSVLVWELRVMVVVIAAVLIWLLVTGRLTG